MEPEAAWALFTTPPECPDSGASRRALERASAFELGYTRPRLDGEGPLAAYSWGSGPTVFLAHGWGGRGVQLSAFVDPLVEEGFRVLAVDAPAHGSSPGRRTNIYEFAGTLETAAEALGPIHAVVGHSLGAAAAVIVASRGLSVGRLVLIAATARLSDEVAKFATRVGLPDEDEQGLRRYMERFRAGIWEETTLARHAPGIDVPALIVHDEHDPDVDYRDSVELAEAWPSSEFFGTAGLGHVAPLRNREVTARVAEYVARRK